MYQIRLAVAWVAILGLVGCGSEQDTVMPDVVGQQLDVALEDIKSAGVDDDVEIVGGGTFGVVDESNWKVCEQSPAAGQSVTEAPQLTVDRSCGTEEDSDPVTESSVPAPATTEEPASTATPASTAPPATPAPTTAAPAPPTPAATEPPTTAPPATPAPTPAPTEPPVEKYANCAAVNADFPDGLPADDPRVDGSHNRDNDDMACESQG
jgi:beta-lactam-binding protein with PASTA domain